jgi:hypothetical protein
MNEPQLCWRSPTNPSLYKTRGGSPIKGGPCGVDPHGGTLPLVTSSPSPVAPAPQAIAVHVRPGSAGRPPGAERQPTSQGLTGGLSRALGRVPKDSLRDRSRKHPRQPPGPTGWGAARPGSLFALSAARRDDASYPVAVPWPMPVSLKPLPLTVGLLSVLVSTSAGPQSGKEANYAETGQHNHGHVDHGNPADLVTVHDVDAERHYHAAEARARSGRQAADPRAPPSATSVGSAPGGSTDGGGISPSPPPPPPNTRAAGITRSPPF